MSLISLSGAYLAYSDAPLLDNAELHIEMGERVCIVGRNGAGKSTLMKVISKELALDDGRIIYENETVIARLEQDPPRHISGTVFDYIAEGVSEQASLLSRYHAVSHEVATNYSEALMDTLFELQAQLDHHNLWSLESRINEVILQLGLVADAELSSLSGGWMRKAALGRALVRKPNVLLLDEPTNHLDITTIEWLEQFLKSFNGAIIFISHDRAFIRSMATRIVDLDRGVLTSWPGNYELYLEGKEEQLRVEALQNAEFDKKLAQEEVWIRQGIKARRTRNEGRVRALKALRNERAARREVLGKANLNVNEATRSGKIVFDLENVYFERIDNQTGEMRRFVDNFTAKVLRQDKIGLIGPNGCGKTTLIKLLLEELKPTSGRLHVGTKLDVAYFDQYRAELDPDKTVMDNLAEGKQEVLVNGRPRHVLGYLQDFLFPPKRAMTPVRALSGGERNRLLLAKLFLKPSNLLILDEPTNDLDVETLELLEELVDGYQGTVLLVSHDREFIDSCVSECWIFEGEGKISSFVGGYYDAHQQRTQSIAAKAELNNQSNAAEKSNNKINEPKNTVQAKSQQPANQTKRRLSFKEQKELEMLPAELERLESEIETLNELVSASDFFSKPHTETEAALKLLADTQAAFDKAFSRWEELEANGI
ncbi:ABC transporter ATP-binding protein [Thorsellia anophelis]|uniref:ATP-binding protein Uup n=1 Tax=Thorsellia anophelis DSM 18579 TaxID=1123402 RepID=A0A1I0APY6_9GAMM|nr:ABC transporter ATP-binding protein [Thorsellia anophelis]SES96336.1 ATP-binding cassette, subfamily F, uup [Thorsellia anophelis DSM 18579]